MISFTVYGKAEPAGSKRGFAHRKGGVFSGKVIITDDNPKSSSWKQEVTLTAIKAMQGTVPLQGPIVLQVVVYRDRPKGHIGSKGQLRKSAPLYPITKPDATKLLRGIEDALRSVVYHDDAQVVDQRVVKLYGGPARAEIRVEALPSGNGDLIAKS